MSEKVFREKISDKAISPDDLGDYIKVASPTVWLLLISLIALLVGVCVWGAFGRIDSTVPSSVHLEGGEALCYIAEENISSVRTGMTVRFAGQEVQIESIGEDTERGYACTLSRASDLPDGYYDGKVITESHKPFSFLLN